MVYNWQRDDWPDFRFDLHEAIRELLIQIALHAGNSSGLLEGLPEDMETEAVLELMISEAIETSEIEGESLQHADVMSSIKNHLGLAVPTLPVRDQAAEGVGRMTVRVRKEFQSPLNEGMLFEWHKLLMEGRGIPVGQWREGDDPMQVVSGRIDKPTVHFQAPPSAQVPHEMKRFIRWFNDSEKALAGPVRSAVAHLYFESIHPFEDGNGRIGRAVSEKALSQGLGHPALLSLSKTIVADKKAYYDALKSAQKHNEITGWIEYFVKTVLQAQINAEEDIRFVLKKAKFLGRFESRFNPRQKKAVDRMFKAGSSGFEGGMNARKYVSITKTSKATATRDLQALVAMGALRPSGGGRSTSYHLNLD